MEAVFEVGRVLLLAKRELPHGEFMAMAERELPFSVSAADKYMAVASAEHLQIRNIVTNLPPSWGTLAALARLDRPTFEAAVAAGKIHPEMTRADAEALLPKRTLAPVVPMVDEARGEKDRSWIKLVAMVPDGLTCDRQTIR